MIKRNIKLLKLDNFFAGFWPLSTLLVVYFETITHSYALAMTVLAFSSLMTTAMEIPMGLLSDRLGRRETLILAISAMVGCFLSWAIAGQFEFISLLFLGSFLFGVSSAATSGTDEALIYETMEELGKKDDFDILFSRSRTYNQIGIACGALSAAAITYFCSVLILAWVSLLPVLGRLIISFFYVEPKHVKEPKNNNSIKHFLLAWHQLIRSKKTRFYATIQMIDVAFGTASFRFESVYYETLVAAWLVNIARFVKQVFGAFSFFVIPYIRKWGYAQLFFGSLIGNALSKLIGVILNNVFSPFIMALQNLFHGPATTASAVILQNEFSPRQRATMKSIISFGTSIFMALAMFLLGAIADATTPRTAIALAIGIKIVMVIISLFLLKKVLKDIKV